MSLAANYLSVGVLTNSSGIMITPNPKSMWRLERVWEESNRTPVLLVSGSIILMVAVADWWTKPFVAFGVLYLFPSYLQQHSSLDG
jgi:hypothetical protein